MNLKTRKKLLVLTMNTLVLTALLLIQEHEVEHILQRDWPNRDYVEVMTKTALMVHNKWVYNWITAVCLGLLVLNLFLYRQWVKSKRWIFEPVLILVISYGLAFSFFTYRTFAVKEQLIEAKS